MAIWSNWARWPARVYSEWEWGTVSQGIVRGENESTELILKGTLSVKCDNRENKMEKKYAISYPKERDTVRSMVW